MVTTMNSVLASESTEKTQDKTFIDKILGEMKSQFNRSDKNDDSENAPSSPVSIKAEKKTEDPAEDETGKPRIVLLFKKPSAEKALIESRRSSLRNKANSEDKTDETMLKRSARRRSKDCNESVLQSAIARKEKSYNEASKPQRLTRQLKPTQKILENLALAKQEKTKRRGEDDVVEKVHKKHKHKKAKKAKRGKSEQGSDSEHELENGSKEDENANCRRSRRISSSRPNSKEADDLPNAEPKQENEDEEENAFLPQQECSSVGAELIASRLCLCTQKSNFYTARNDEEVIYCSAIDSIDKKNIGCSRAINAKEIVMLRPSTRVPYAIFCRSHINRLLRHNCCPTCGIFCSQGRFVECENKHQYHRECQISVGNMECCPHCGQNTPNFDVSITMQTAKRPVFLPIQKAQYSSARISFNTNGQNDDEIKCVTPPLLPLGALKLLNASTVENPDEYYDINDLFVAIKEEDLEKTAAILSSKGVDLSVKIPEINDGTVLHYAAQNGLIAVVHMLLTSGLQPDMFDKDQNTPLMLAILAGKNEVVQYLTRTGSTLNLKGTDGMTALHLAAKCGNIKSCELLLKSPNSLKNFVNVRDDGGWTPLVWACEHGFADVVNFLIFKGADPCVRDVEHNVALHWAAFSGSSHIVDLLLSRGCEINAVNAHGDTPLHIGARQDSYNCVIVLLARGANVTIINKNNETPLDCVPPDGTCYSPICLNVNLQTSIDWECHNVILTNDISKGKEQNPIQCFNDVDEEMNPCDFVYVTKNCLTTDDVKVDAKITTIQSCLCEERCVEDDCFCGKLSLKCWYDEEGKLSPDFNYSDLPMIFECNDGCSCNTITCNNRVVQKGLTQRFEVFKTNLKGWGVRSLREIPKGSFVCEYIGEIITDFEAERRDDDSYLFDLENRICKNVNEADGYCIDAKFYGNFARFVNHSCNPNLTSVKVFVDHQDLRFPRIAFFASRDILPKEELSYDYGDKFWLAKYKCFTCYCGSPECKYSEDTIKITVQNYQRKLEENCN